MGLGIYVRRPAPTTVIESNHVENTDHNSIQVVGVSAGPDVTITGNTLINWDRNRDADAGRAIRINFDPVDASTTLAVIENTFNPGDDTTNRVDPEYVKITGVDAAAVGNLITQLADENTWTNDPDFAVVIRVNDAHWGPASITKDDVTTNYPTAQEALDVATDGDTIRLFEGDHGTLYLRQSELSRKVDVTDWAGDGDVERYREFKNISIVGTTGAKVDQIAVEAQLYPSTGTGHSNDNGENLSSYISISNLTLKNIEFTGNKPVAVNLQSIWGHSGVNGLTIDGCTLTGKATDKEAQTSFLLRADGDTPTEIKDKTTNELIMTTGRSDLTVKNCTVDNVWMPINITEWNDITISNNHFSNSGRNDIQVSGPSTGTVSITGNTLDGAGERTIRLNNLTGGVTITGNTITNCVGRTTDTLTSLMHFSAAGDDTTVYLSGNSWNGDTDEQATVDKLIIDSPAVVTVEND